MLDRLTPLNFEMASRRRSRSKNQEEIVDLWSHREVTIRKESKKEEEIEQKLAEKGPTPHTPKKPTPPPLPQAKAKQRNPTPNEMKPKAQTTGPNPSSIKQTSRDSKPSEIRSGQSQ